ncbi:DUF4238 domain-containing protein [Ramlibacter sp.]|uniref:DUF4238 domain-containing protein n=1 Tax=Ramlibacter sp. TaxID=1917967 RepID=UPI00263875AF|nr:DUF4238 domain-containing protein [Ramlibacter sp.]MDB5956442.1 hypothetical protein [Ramlibacter sp.]
MKLAGAAPKPVNQHWVPKFYLRYFATPETRDTDAPQVWIFSKREDDGDEKLTHVRNVCAKRFLYSPLGDDGERNWDLESRLGEVESLLARRWPEFAEGFAPLEDQPVRMSLSLFVAIMHMRNPVLREEVERMHERFVRAFEDAPLRADGSPEVKAVQINGQTRSIDTSDWNSYRAWSKNDHDRFFAGMVQREAGHIAKLLLKKRWSVLHSERDVFITTDKPVGTYHQGREKFGFGTDGVVVTFPLGPKRLLVMDDLHDEPANQHYQLKEGNAGWFNMTTWQGASRLMITGRPIPEVLSEILALEHR